MAMFATRRDSAIFMVTPSTPPTTTSVLADGYTDEPLSRMGSRRQSRFSYESMNGRRHGSRASTSMLSDSSIVDQAKRVYDRYNLRSVVPFIILFLYSLIGAFTFYWTEYDYEQQLLRQETVRLENLRNETFHRLKAVMSEDILSAETKLYNSRDILVWYESQLRSVVSPVGMEWDMWGSLFFVSTIFTTIGYGNIYPRTNGGKALSMVYAIIGIPLVLAILNQFGTTLTRLVSSLWMRYRECVKAFADRKRRSAQRRAKRLISKDYGKRYDKSDADAEKMEEGRIIFRPTVNGKSKIYHDDPAEYFEFGPNGEIIESRTIPVWLALLMCVAWICGCAGLFCIWETQWTYFTSLYFFFISLSTIGLGDVVPDHPHMMILMFWLVIIGLSIVSMLLSVIQIKIEEWLYHLMIKMRKEYQKAIENGDTVKAETILRNLMKKEPWFMRHIAPRLISNNQAAKLNSQAEVFERSVRSLNNKDVQTDENAALSPSLIRSSEHGIATNEVGDISVASSIQLSSALPTQRLHTPLRPQSVEVDEDVHQEHITHDHMPRLDSNEASLSEATSLPLDPVSVVSPEAVKVVKVDVQSTSNEEQPPADESYDESTGKFVQTDIAQFQVDEIMLKLYNLQNRRQPEVDKCCETSESLDIPKDGAIKKRHTAGLDLLNNIAMQPGKELTDQGILAVDEHQSLNDTVPLVIVSEEPECRSTQTSPFFQNHSIGTDPIEKTNLNDDNVRFLNRSMETDAWMSQIHTPECSRAVQTSFNDLTVTNEELPFPADLNEEKQSNACVDTCDMSVQTQLSMTEMKNERNLIPDRPGPSWIMDSEDDESHCENSKQDLIVQTDDSYLKIARRLDELRSKRTQFLAVYTATPLKDEHRTNSFRRRNRDSLKLWAEKPSDRKGFSLDVLRGSRRSMKRSGGRDAPTTPGVKVTHFHPSGEDIIESSEVTNPSQPSLASNSNKSLQAQREPFEKSRSIPPTFATFPLISSAKLKRKSSSPPKIQPGTVSAFIKFHERGIHNPGTLEGIRAGRTEAIDARKHSCI